MPTYRVTWTEEFEAIVTAKNEDEAINKAEFRQVDTMDMVDSHSYEAEFMEDDPE